ncbi:MAG: hypothetical protein CVU56_28510 [Deltaproteobacteria bacterium HGW-Deltaproteobacteria-14]|nr:MAG: hypothetical protein CVU56_28510 [Deltaproteobacteria bacterium HGW-Deltaproteobacteria-14]
MVVEDAEGADVIVLHGGDPKVRRRFAERARARVAAVLFAAALAAGALVADAATRSAVGADHQARVRGRSGRRQRTRWRRRGRPAAMQ